MLAKRERLTTAAFNDYFKSGKRFHSPTLQLIYTPREQFHGAVVVGKKVYKKAVDRNRLRRRLYGALYHLSRQQALTGVFIITTKPAAKDTPYTDVRTDLGELVGRISKKG